MKAKQRMQYGWIFIYTIYIYLAEADKHSAGHSKMEGKYYTERHDFQCDKLNNFQRNL